VDLQVNRPGVPAECGLGHEDDELLGLVQDMVLAAHPARLLVPLDGIETDVDDHDHARAF